MRLHRRSYSRHGSYVDAAEPSSWRLSNKFRNALRIKGNFPNQGRLGVVKA